MNESQPCSLLETTIDIPTYTIGPADKNPPLWDDRVYPYPLQTSIAREKTVQTYRAIILENDYIRVIVVPELGGKLYAAHDKTNDDHDFIYHNHVVKPGLVALRGAWISGGIEWNFPTRGHAVHTISPVPYKSFRSENGSVSCIVGTTEWVRRMQWSVAITVYPGRSYVHNRIRLVNPTLSHHRAYFWSNAAAHAWDDTRVYLPPTDHTYMGLRLNPEPWPIVQSRDVSWYKNTPYPHDYFCGATGEFHGAYHVQHECGTVHVADPQDVFGRKFWTWGTARSGTIWEDFLTDADGQYIEIQSGRLPTQGDTWMFEPHMREQFDEYWYPVKQLGGLTQANRGAAMNVDARDGRLLVALNVTSRLTDATIELVVDGKPSWRMKATLDPASAWRHEIEMPTGAGVDAIILRDVDGRELLAYRPNAQPPLPKPDTEPELPPDVANATVEEIYLKGYYARKHWKTQEALTLLDEALRRDPGFTPAQRMMATVYYQAGQYEKALESCQKVLRRNDDDDTARYYRALSKARLEIGERTDQDLHLLGRRAAYRHVIPYILAARAIRRGDFSQASANLRLAIDQNPGDMKAQTMLAAISRCLGKAFDAERLVDAVLVEHPIERLALIERVLQGGRDELALLADDPQQYIETACDYLEMNLPTDAQRVLELYQAMPKAVKHPLIDAYLGFLADRAGRREQAETLYRQAAALSTQYVFPFRIEDIDVLRVGIRYLPDSPQLHGYLGMLLATLLQPQTALRHLTEASKRDSCDPVVYRNLGEIYWRQMNDLPRAVDCYEEALALDSSDVAYYVALDSLYSLLNKPAERERLLSSAPAAVRADDRVLLRQASYFTDVGRYDEALEILRRNVFAVWEFKAEAHQLYVRTLHARGDQYMQAGDYNNAIADFLQAMEYPENLGAGKPHLPNFLCEYYKLGLCHQALGQVKVASEYFVKAIHCPPDPPREDAEIRKKAQQQVTKSPDLQPEGGWL
ncbi:MAG: DUF5107 domain-containing protein [Pirellulales bacterium]|nr:DUF5107 domain-containing protein [Pirellulales bacterium]